MTGDELAATVRRLRTQAQLTQEELADRAGISVRAVSDIERGSRRRIYPTTARQLATALQLSPTEQAAFGRIARGPAQTLTTTPSDLPTPRTALFGRQREIDELSELLAGSPPLLVTVTGPGGVGKTRLALETARVCSSQFPAVHWVELGQVAEPALTLTTIARSVRATPTGADLLAALARELGVRRSLLILDTFEQLLPAAPDLTELLTRCPTLTVLVTSRARLRLTGEREFALGPIAVPSGSDVLQADSVALFIDRARAANRDLAIEPALVAQICRCAEGIPLAIELAAARTRHLSLPDLAAQLANGSGVLRRGAQDQPQRQDSMQATVAWSYNLLDATAQTFLRRLAVFSSWTLDQAAATCTDGLTTDPLDVLSTLLDHSLVAVSPDDGTATRYRMLDVVREYVADEAPTETTELRARHAGYFLDLVHQLEPLLRATGQSAAHLRLDADLPNLRSAHRWLLENDPPRALTLAAELWMFWLWRGGVPEGRRWLTEALDAGGDGPARAKALWGAGWLAFHQGDVDQTTRYADELRRLAGEHPVHRRNALTLRGMTAMAAGDFDAARSSFATAQEALRATGERWLKATSALNLGIAELHAGDVSGAERRFVAAAQQYAELGDQTYLDRANRHLAATALVFGQLDRAEQLFAAEIVRDAGRTEWGVAESLEGLSWLAAACGDVDSSTELARDAAAIRARLGVQLHPFDVLLSRRFRG